MSGYVADEVRAVRRIGNDDIGETFVQRRRGHGTELVHEAIVEDEYRPSRSRRDHDIVSRRRAVSLERGRVAGYYPSRYHDEPQRSMGAVTERSTYYGDDNRSGRHRRHRSASRGEKLAAGAAGAGLAIAGKEYWDRREGHAGSPIKTAVAGVTGAIAGAEAAKYYERSRDHSRGSRGATFSDTGNHRSRGSSPEDRHRHRKSLGEAALVAVGLGEVARHHGRSRSHSRSRSLSGSHHRRRSSSASSSHGHPKMKQAAQAAVTAAVVEAFASRNDPGSIFGGERGRRIAQAAVAAGGLDAAVDRDPDHHGKRHIAEAVLGGLAGQRVLNGPHRSRSESRSRSRSTHHHGSSDLGDLAKGGLAMAATKAFLNLRNRSKSRDRSRSRHNSVSSRSASRRRRNSLGGAIEKGLGALGLGAIESEDRHHRHNGNRSPGSRPSAVRRGTGYPHGRARGSSSDSSSSDGMSGADERKTRRKLRGKELIQASLSTIATIHSAHTLYENMEAAKERHKALHDGEITQEEAQREKAKAALKDLASLGLAAWGVRGTVKSWGTMRSKHLEKRDFDHEREMKRRRREHRRARSME
ncbi:MAG: hypothetical protein M1840_004971 [Geoglossum simile]|nr:MAG: hypothetical protein M1840_004971 [Geoglossum simile]